MSILNQEDELKVFPCPSCKRIIPSNVDTCKYCNSPISEETKQAAIKTEEEQNRNHDVEFHRNICMIGVVIFMVGAGLLTLSILNLYAGRGGFFIWSPIIAVFGLGQTIYGLLGMRKAKRR